jgi:multisubunit Na+/H+ antiporter MnhE subunit
VTRRLRNVGLGALLAGGFYLLLIDTVSLPELYVVPAVLLITSAAFILATRTGDTGYPLPIAWLVASWRVLVWVPRDIVLVIRALAAQLIHPRARRGSLRAVPIPDPGDGRARATRAALSESLGSLAPNTIVIGLDPDRRVLLVHQLQRQGDPGGLDPLGGR